MSCDRRVGPQAPQKKWRRIATICLSLLVLFCSAIAVAAVTQALVLWRFGQGPPASLTVAPDQLLFSPSQLPTGWQAGAVNTGRSASALFRGASLAASRGYGIPGIHTDTYEEAWASHFVAWYATNGLAHRNLLDLWEPSFHAWEPWAELASWGYRSPYADESNLVCVLESESGKIVAHRCFYIARYGQYLSWFNVRTLREHLDAEEMKRWIMQIDMMFAEFGDSAIPAVGS